MSEMSSFYGGRQGASFIIVKQYDGIDIPNETQHTGRYYVYETLDGVTKPFVVTDGNTEGAVKVAEGYFLIEQTAKNYKDYSPNSWKYHLDDGEEFTHQGVTCTYPFNYAKGMIQDFKQGATCEVHYGEYVIIDTYKNLHEKLNPDNGKVFRRGMFIENELAGAEYIGQIIGPSGETPVMVFDAEENIRQQQGHETIYLEKDMGLIPGKTEDGSFNDVVSLSYVTMTDDSGNVEGCYIGFTTPYLVTEMTSRAVTPYDENGVNNLDGRELMTRIDDKEHPYYNKWRIDLPQGFKGNSAIDFEIVHTKTMPMGFKSDNFLGAAVYSEPDGSTRIIENGIGVTLRNSTNLLMDEDYDSSSSFAKILYPHVYGGQQKQYAYVLKTDCYMDVVRYKEVNYENLEDGEVTYHTVGDYNDIDRIAMSSDGVISIYYTAEASPTRIQQALKWITGTSLADDGNLTIFYNRDLGNGRNYEIYPRALTWITNAELTPDGNFTITYNNNKIESSGVYHAKLKAIKNLTVNNRNETGLEGSGDQKLYAEYNDIEDPVAISDPINYVVEACISIPKTGYEYVPYSHLLVYYSDPEYRKLFQDKWVRYPSEKYSGQVWTEWVDMGDVRGHAGGVHFLTDVSSASELTVPPEQMVIDGVVASYAAGWCVTLTDPATNISEIMVYDYNDNRWFSIGRIDSSAVNPTSVIIKSRPNTDKMPFNSDIGGLQTGGFWLSAEDVYYIS